MVQKHFYEAPETEPILVRFEGNFMETNPTSEDFSGEQDDNIFGGNRSYNPNRI